MDGLFPAAEERTHGVVYRSRSSSEYCVLLWDDRLSSGSLRFLGTSTIVGISGDRTSNFETTRRKFGFVCRDLRYRLTCGRASAPMLWRGQRIAITGLLAIQEMLLP